MIKINARGVEHKPVQVAEGLPVDMRFQEPELQIQVAQDAGQEIGRSKSSASVILFVARRTRSPAAA